MDILVDLINKFDSFSPGFSKAWENDDLYNDPEDQNVVYDLFCFYSHFIADRLDKDDAVNKLKLFQYVESLFSSKNEDLSNAAATCFLENLIHIVWYEFDGNNFFPYLGKQSIEFLKAWEEFNGMKTKGLW